MKSYKVIGKDYKGNIIHNYECNTMKEAMQLKHDIEIDIEEIRFGVPYETVEIIANDLEDIMLAMIIESEKQCEVRL